MAFGTAVPFRLAPSLAWCSPHTAVRCFIAAAPFTARSMLPVSPGCHTTRCRTSLLRRAAVAHLLTAPGPAPSPWRRECFMAGVPREE